jgi:hypothetical protein
VLTLAWRDGVGSAAARAIEASVRMVVFIVTGLPANDG